MSEKKNVIIIGAGPAGMSAAVAAFFAEGEVSINNAQCANKSYPTFWEEFEAMR